MQTSFVQFRGYNQHDSMEWMRCLLSQLHDDLSQTDKNHSDKSIAKRNSQQTVVKHCFGGVLESHVHCLSCEKVSFCLILLNDVTNEKDFYKEDTFFDLAVQIAQDMDDIDSRSTEEIRAGAFWWTKLASVTTWIG